FREAIQKQSRKRPRRYHGSGSCGCTKRPGFLCLSHAQKSLAPDKRTRDLAQERKSFRKKSGRVAAHWKDVCAHGNTAVDDSRRSDRENRSAWRSRHWECKQEN